MKSTDLAIILFGATGDLSKKKLIPALFELYQKRIFPNNWKIIFFIRRQWQRVDLENFVNDSLTTDCDTNDFISHIEMIIGDITNFDSYNDLAKILDSTNADSKIFYLSISPSKNFEVVTVLNNQNILDKNSKVLIEKPFSTNEDNFKALHTLLKSAISSDNVFYVDHYLCKDMIKNLYIDDKEVDKVEARIIESLLVGDRGQFYDATGAFLDVGSNHLLMMISSLLSKKYRSRKEVLKNLIFENGDLYIGQYDGYREEKDVSKESKTETYFKIKLAIDNIPVYIEGGKGFKDSDSSITVFYKDRSKKVFDFSISSDEALQAYAKVFADSICNNKESFTSYEEIIEEWRLISCVKDNQSNTPLKIYPKGFDLVDKLS